MDLYVKREAEKISLQEWLNYVKTDKDLVLQEVAEAINPITKEKLRIEIPGRVIFSEGDIQYCEGRIGCKGASEGKLKKLREIAAALNAELFDCGEKVG